MLRQLESGLPPESGSPSCSPHTNHNTICPWPPWRQGQQPRALGPRIAAHDSWGIHVLTAPVWRVGHGSWVGAVHLHSAHTPMVEGTSQRTKAPRNMAAPPPLAQKLWGIWRHCCYGWAFSGAGTGRHTHWDNIQGPKTHDPRIRGSNDTEPWGTSLAIQHARIIHGPTDRRPTGEQARKPFPRESQEIGSRLPVLVGRLSLSIHGPAHLGALASLARARCRGLDRRSTARSPVLGGSDGEMDGWGGVGRMRRCRGGLGGAMSFRPAQRQTEAEGSAA
jgi:hypothetical protein